MRAFLVKGHGMTASLKMEPDTVRMDRDPDIVPDNVRGWQITIDGFGDESLVLQGSTKEMRTMVALMNEGAASMQEQSKDGGTMDTAAPGPYVEAHYDGEAPDPGRPIRLTVNGGRSYMLTKGDAEHLWYSLTSAIGRC